MAYRTACGLGGSALVLLAASLLQAEEPAAFRYSRNVETAGQEREEMVAVVLDSGMYDHTRIGMPDLRLFDAAGKEVPFLLEKVTATRRETVRKPWTVPAKSLKPLDDGGLEIDLVLDKDDPQPSGLTVVTPLRNFEQRLRVFGSNDGQSWEPLVSDALIFDYSQFMDVHNLEVPLPDNTFRRFRVIVDAATAEQESELMELTRRLQNGAEEERTERVLRQRRPFRIERVRFWRDVVEKRASGPATRDYPVVEFHVENDADHKQTVITVQTHREPLTAFELETPARNFTRQVSVKRPIPNGVRTEWQPTGQATISRFAFRNLQREQLEVKFPETRCERYELTIENQDNPPLEITGVRAEGNVYRMVYFAAPGEKYRVAYGADTIAGPRYDTTALAASLGKGYQPVEAELGKVVENLDVRSSNDILGLLNNRLLWIVVVCVLVVVLGWGLYTAARRVDALPVEDNEESSR